MDSILYIVIAIIAFVFGGVVINTKNRRTVELYKEEADKQAFNAVKAKAKARKSTIEKKIADAASDASSEIVDSLMERESKTGDINSIMESPSTVLSDEERKHAEEILSDCN